MNPQLVWLYDDLKKKYSKIKRQRAYKDSDIYDIKESIDDSLIHFAFYLDKAGKKTRAWNWIRLGFLNEFFHRDDDRSTYKYTLSEGKIYSKRYRSEPPEIYRVLVQSANESIFIGRDEEIPVYPMQFYKIHQYFGREYLSVDPSITTEDEVDRYLSYLDMLEQYNQRHLSEKILGIYETSCQAAYHLSASTVPNKLLGTKFDDREASIFEAIEKYSDATLKEKVLQEQQVEEKIETRKKELDELEQKIEDRKETIKSKEDIYSAELEPARKLVDELDIPLNGISLDGIDMNIHEIFDFAVIRYLIGIIDVDFSECNEKQWRVFDYYLGNHPDVHRGNLGILKDPKQTEELVKCLFSCFCQFDDACKGNYSELLREYLKQQGELFVSAGNYPLEINKKAHERIQEFLQQFEAYVAEKRSMGKLNSTVCDEIRMESTTTIQSEEKRKSGRTPRKTEKLSTLMSDLDHLIGLKAVKQQVYSLINLIKIRKIRQKQGLDNVPMSLHLVFSGNPGTGKTTVARLLAKIYKKLGVLSRGTLTEVDRSGLVGEYVGQTALKVQDVIQGALGGILFIDEAYSLTVNRSEQDYGKEAVDTLLKGMEDHRDDLIVIVAGYTDEMKEFLQSNPGLESRFNTFIEFQDYTASELFQIFELLCTKHYYVCDAVAEEHVKKYLEEVCRQKEKNFANGRFVRNYFEKVLLHQANRLAEEKNLDKKDLLMIVFDDVNQDIR